MDSVIVSQKRPREGGQGCHPEPELDHLGDEQEHRRKRARLSCNTCKARKTKVSLPVTLAGGGVGRLLTPLHSVSVEVRDCYVSGSLDVHRLDR